MGERPGGDEIDPRCRDGPYRAERHVPRCLGEGPAPDERHGFLHGLDGHVVQHDEVCARLEGFTGLGEGFYLHLDPRKERGPFADPPHSLSKAPGRLDVVVLDQDPVVEPVAVVPPPADPHAVLVKNPQARHGLAGVENHGLRAGDGPDELRRQRGDPAHPLQEVEGDPFGREDAGQVAPDRGQDGPTGHVRAVLERRRKGKAGVTQSEGFSKDLQTGHDQIFLGKGRRRPLFGPREDAGRRQVPRADVFLERSADDPPDRFHLQHGRSLVTPMGPVSPGQLCMQGILANMKLGSAEEQKSGGDPLHSLIRSS